MKRFTRVAAILWTVLPLCALAEAPKKVSKHPPKSVPVSGRVAPVALPKPICKGEYADDLAVLPEQMRLMENQAQSQFTHCVRNTAIYECLSYAADGTVRRVKKKAIAHGTAFAYRQQSGETLLVTNQHVAEMPAVTDEEHVVDDIPLGCKRVSDTLKIVEKESDAYERDDIPLTRVVTDPQLDVAILKAHQGLNTMPWKVGRSAALRERNVVDIRGFPLGAFKATNVGKVISAYDHDDYKEWDHDDFIVDALLSPGNSGSPVLALSCTTGEFELVGIYHAGYTNGSALNVVIGIDQVRDLMSTLKKTPRTHAEAPSLDASARTRLTDEVRTVHDAFFPFGALTGLLRVRPDGALIYELFSKEFPAKSYPVLVLEDLPPLGSDAFGELGRVWFGGATGLKMYSRAELDAEAQITVTRMLDLVRHDAIAAVSYRVAGHSGVNTRERFDAVTHLERTVKKAATAQHDLSQTASDLSDRLAPHGNDVTVTLGDALSAPTLTRAMPVIPDPAVGSGSGGPAAGEDGPSKSAQSSRPRAK